MNKINWLILIMLSCIKLTYAVDVTPITNFNSSEYLGTWYEIARLPNKFEKQCIAPVTANYTVNPKHSDELIVVNQCMTKDNKSDIATGVAYFVESANVGKLKVTFLPKFLRWLPFGYGDYWILSVDYSRVVVIGSPNHEYLWILARSSDLNSEVLKKAILVAKEQGFDTAQLVFNYNSQSLIEQK